MVSFVKPGSEKTERLRCCWQVTAGVIPGKQEVELTRRYYYTEDDADADRKAAEANLNVTTNKFTQQLIAAHDYAKGLTQPQHLNWVNVEWLWY